MAIALVVNGVTYQYPQVNDTDWGPDATDWASAITSGVLQKAGGLFQLLAEVDYGSAFGVKSLYYKSRTANTAAAGQIRLARTDNVSWRNNANSADLNLTVDASDNLLFNGAPIGGFSVGDTATIDLTFAATILTADIVDDSITNTMINSSAAIAYSKLALTDSIQNSDINATAGIVYTKLSLTDSIMNADVNSSAAIAYSKLNLSDSIVGADINASAAIARSKIATGSNYRLVTNGAAGALTDAAAITAARALVSDANGIPTHSAVTDTELGYVSGVTSAIQTQLDTKAANPMTTGGDIIYGGASGVPTRLANGSVGQIIRSAGGTSAPTWQNELPITSASTTYTALTSDKFILADSTAGDFTITLYTAVGNAGRTIAFRKTNSGTSSVEINPDSTETIDGRSSILLIGQYESVTLVSDGANWQIIAQNLTTILNTTSSPKTPAGGSQFQNMALNSVSPTKGLWKIFGVATWSSAPSAGFNRTGVVITSADGADSGVFPTGLPPSGSTLVAPSNTGFGSFTGATVDQSHLNTGDIYLRVTNLAVTVYCVPYTEATTPANATVTTYLSAVKVGF